jgi:hypothetical protein
MPNLRSFEIMMMIEHRTRPWFRETLSQILQSNPAEIIVSYSGVQRYQPDRSYETALKALETLFLLRPAVPCLRLRLGHGPRHFTEHGFANCTDLGDVFSQAMPTLHAMEKVVVEKYVLDWRDNI